jgi:hypothetical protein
MLIKSCTQENDDVFILFGGSGSEIILCKEQNATLSPLKFTQNTTR